MPDVKEIRYSLNSEALDQTFKFKPSDKSEIEANDQVYISVPDDSQFANVRVTYKDGTLSPVQKVVRTK